MNTLARRCMARAPWDGCHRLRSTLAFIQKPFTGAAVVRKIREVLAADPPPLA
jgi:hypothetical protein